ncbi:hypothetical protein BVY04_00685, partial [bacterium M21]
MQEQTKLQEQWRRYWPLLLIIGVVVALYGRTTGFDFLEWDDRPYIVDNPVLQQVSVDNLRSIFTPGGIEGELLYIPFSYLSFLPNTFFFGLNAIAAHSLNIILHGANGILAFLLCFQLFKNRNAALFAALLFIVHPLQVGAVSWAFCRRDLLSGLFALLFLLVHLKWRATRRSALLWLALLFYTCGVLSKPNMIFLPFVCILLPWLQSVRPGRQQWSLPLLYLLPMGLLLWLNSQANSGQNLNIEGQLYYLSYLPEVTTQWLGRILLLINPNPYHLSLTLQPELIRPLALLAPAILMLVLYVAYRTNRKMFICLLIAGFALLPAGHVLIAANRQFYTADHYGYIAMLGFTGAFAAAISQWITAKAAPFVFLGAIAA